jgi:hypothetical protein
MSATRPRRRRPVKGAPVLALGLSAVFAATTLAASGNSVKPIPPPHPRAGVDYSIRVKGHASRSDTLYLFADYRRCAATPSEEHYLHGAFGYIWYHVKGDFDKASGLFKSRARRDHACAYLVKSSEPKNPNRGVVARGFATYRVH